MIQATQVRVGMVIQLEGNLCRVMTVDHITPGNWRGMVQTRLRDLKSGNSFERRFRSEERIEDAFLDRREMEYLYSSGDEHTFMDNQSYEQITLSSDDLAGAVQYLTPNMKVQIELHEGRPVGIELPLSVNLKVVETEPGLKGATASNSMKPAKLETGLTVQVPPFISAGDLVKIDTAEGRYIERVK